MSQYEIYTFILCLIVFVILTAFSVILLGWIIKLSLSLIRGGAEDKALLLEEEEKKKHPKKIGVSDVFSFIFSLVVCLALVASFLFSVYVQATKGKAANGVPSLKVVQSGSMSYADKKNTYLKENNVDNHLQTFDLILTEHLPDEFDLQLYDIVVYEQQNGEMVIHRIVGIEEPNQSHPDCRHFKLQGDAVPYPDSYPVLYSQMRGIWTGYRVPFVGSFIMFMQSPAGWICILLMIIAWIAVPLISKKVEKSKAMRLAELHRKGIYLPTSDYTVRSTVLSHFRMTMELQPYDPKVSLRFEKDQNKAEVTLQKEKKTK